MTDKRLLLLFWWLQSMKEHFCCMKQHWSRKGLSFGQNAAAYQHRHGQARLLVCQVIPCGAGKPIPVCEGHVLSFCVCLEKAKSLHLLNQFWLSMRGPVRLCLPLSRLLADSCSDQCQVKSISHTASRKGMFVTLTTGFGCLFLLKLLIFQYH